MSARLQKAAGDAAAAFSEVAERGSIGALETVWPVLYRSPRAAAKTAKILLGLRMGHGEAADAPPALVDSTGLRVQCMVNEYLANEDAFRFLAGNIAVQDTGAVVRVDKDLKKRAQGYTRLFDPSLIAEMPLGMAGNIFEPVLPNSSWRKDIVTRHLAVMEFLRLFVSLCSSEKPIATYARRPGHSVEIKDLSTIIVDGVIVNFNAARKAALFTLAILGTENVPVEAFGRLYDHYLNPDSANYANTFGQAIQGLRKSLVDIEVVKVRPHHRTILGMIIRSRITANEFIPWLRGRRLKL